MDPQIPFASVVQELRWLKWKFRFLLVFCVVAIAAGASGGKDADNGAKMIEGRGFVLKDAAGKTRAELLVGEHGAALTMYDGDGAKCIELEDGILGPNLILLGPKDSSR